LIATFKASPTESCYPSKIIVTEANITGDIIEWRVFDNNGRTAATSTAVTPTFNIPSEGKYTITLKTTSSLTGQTAQATNQTVTVYAKPFASFDARPDVTIYGFPFLTQVLDPQGNAVSLTYDELLALPRAEQISPFHCVTGWTVKDVHWAGVRFKHLLPLAEPLPEARAILGGRFAVSIVRLTGRALPIEPATDIADWFEPGTGSAHIHELGKTKQPTPNADVTNGR